MQVKQTKWTLLKHDTSKQYASAVMSNIAENICHFDTNDGCIDLQDDFDALLSGQDKVSDASEGLLVDDQTGPKFFCPPFTIRPVTTTP